MDPVLLDLHCPCPRRGFETEWDQEPLTRVTSCRLRFTHDQLREGANTELYGGSPMILSGLKTLLETGEQLDTPGSVRYSGAAESAG